MIKKSTSTELGTLAKELRIEIPESFMRICLPHQSLLAGLDSTVPASCSTLLSFRNADNFLFKLTVGLVQNIFTHKIEGGYG